MEPDHKGPRRAPEGLWLLLLSTSRPLTSCEQRNDILAAVRGMECGGKGWEPEGGLAGTADGHVIAAGPFSL